VALKTFLLTVTLTSYCSPYCPVGRKTGNHSVIFLSMITFLCWNRSFYLSYTNKTSRTFQKST